MTVTIAEIADFLRSHGQAAMAFQVEQLERQQKADRSGLESAVEAINALRAKYEPPRWRPPDHVARGRTSD